jgi:hypothetical protein
MSQTKIFKVKVKKEKPKKSNGEYNFGTDGVYIKSLGLNKPIIQIIAYIKDRPKGPYLLH